MVVMAENRVQRRLAAILAADMVGYSRLMGEDETGTITRQKAHRSELIDPKIAEHNGRIVKTTGDGLLVEFGSAVDAVLCAVEIQRAMAEREAQVPDKRRIAYRVGINLGEIVIDGEDILGDGVNVAARLEALAEPGGIRISEAVFKNVTGKLDLGFADLGPQTVKNITEPVSVYEILLDPSAAGQIVRARPKLSRRRSATATFGVLALIAVVVLYWQPWEGNQAEAPTIAVVRFANLSGDPKQDYLGRGIALDIFTDISKVSGMLVASWEASSRINPSTLDPEEVGRRLKVSYILTGTIRASGDTLRVSVRLISTSTGYNLWSERYDRKSRQIFALQDDITKNVVTALKVRLSPAEKAQVGRRTTSDPAAHDLVLRARASYPKWTPASNAETIALYREAIEKDPSFAQAYSELAHAYFQKWHLEGSRNPTALDEGLAAAKKAIALDPKGALAHSQLGWMLLWRREHDLALRAMHRSIKLNPNSTYALARLSEAYMFAGKPAEGLKYMQRARKRVQFEPFFYGFWAGECYFYMGRHKDAVRELKSSIAKHPRFFPIRRFLAAVYVEMGRMKEAREQIKMVRKLNPGVTISYLRRALPFKNKADLERQLRALKKAGLPD